MKRVNCPNCGHRLRYTDEQAGRRACCQKCDQPFRLPPAAHDPWSALTDNVPAGGGSEGWTDSAEQLGAVLNEAEELKSLRDRIVAVIAETLRYDTLAAVLQIPKGKQAAVRLAQFTQACDEVNRRIDSAPPDRRVAVAKELLDEHTERLAAQKKRHGREVRSLAVTAAWKLPLLAVQWLFVLFLLGAMIAGGSPESSGGCSASCDSTTGMLKTRVRLVGSGDPAEPGAAADWVRMFAFRDS